MRFNQLTLAGAYRIDPERLEDERGFFARLWCERECAAHGLNTRLVQANVSFNSRKGTLRGLHYQAEPYAEAKVVRCTRGALFFVLVDLRRSSGSYGLHESLVLEAEACRTVYLPEGFANGFLTLEDNTEVTYWMSETYHQAYARGIRWDDPCLKIAWPEAPSVISDRDRNLPFLREVPVCS